MKIYKAIFAISIVAFNAANYPALFGSLGSYVRYPCLAVLTVVSIGYAFNRRLRIPPALLASFYLFVSYAFVTAFWTENTKLTIVKWLIYSSMTLSLLVGGLIVSDDSSANDNPFSPLKWVFVPIVLLSVLSVARGGGWLAGNFRGYAGNSNALGATIMLTSPWLLYEIYKQWGKYRHRVALVSLGVAAVAVLFLTFSRASIGGALILVSSAMWSANLGKKFVIGYVTIALLIGTYIVRPTTFRVFYSDVVEKRSESVLKSRSEQMEDSWDAAKKGGMLGAGFGVSVGTSKYWEEGRFSTFSREKGNSTLAVVEELGIIGLLLYLLLLYAILASTRQVFRSNDPDSKFLYTLSIGFFCAAIFHSAFEAWFLSSGPDVAVFWSTIGIFIGTLSFRSRQANGRFPRMETAARAGVFVPASAPRR